MFFCSVIVLFEYLLIIQFANIEKNCFIAPFFTSGSNCILSIFWNLLQYVCI